MSGEKSKITKTEKLNKKGTTTKRAIERAKQPKIWFLKWNKRKSGQQTGKFGKICYFIFKKQTVFWKNVFGN